MKRILTLLTAAAFAVSCSTEESRARKELARQMSDEWMISSLAAVGGGVSMNAGSWNIRYSLNLPAHPTQSGAGWYFDWKKDTSEIHYLSVRHTSAITAAYLTMEGVVETSSPSVVFDHVTERSQNPGGLPSAFRFYIEKDMYGSEFNRWFSNPFCVVLKPGPFSLTVALKPENFSSVYGKFGNYSSASRAGFAKVLASPKAVGLVFGGGDFFGHGVKVRNGTARLRMTSYALK